MDIQITAEMQARVMARSQAMIGELVVASYQREDLIEQSAQRILELSKAVEFLKEDSRLVREKLEQSYRDNEELRKQIDPTRGNRFMRNRRTAKN